MHLVFKLCIWLQKRLVYRENKEIFLSETIMLRALIFGIQNHLVVLYQVCSNNGPGAKNGPALKVAFYIGLFRENI